ncbi:MULTISPECIES: hypothetical protein [unclassified Pseudomonas]|uniref:hypothetical protein n=1 Tax=unclassified Pseudomonas TaxID=196821 RepID=UPI0021146766|nr:MULTISPECIES: hypothetical protein [unclassified Pseudomonas]
MREELIALEIKGNIEIKMRSGVYIAIQLLEISLRRQLSRLRIFELLTAHGPFSDQLSIAVCEGTGLLKRGAGASHVCFVRRWVNAVQRLAGGAVFNQRQQTMDSTTEKYALEIEIFTLIRRCWGQISRSSAQKRRFR